MNTLLYNKKHTLTSDQVENMKGLGLNVSIKTTEKECLKELRTLPITKRFKLTDFSEPKFDCVIKPLIKNKCQD